MHATPAFQMTVRHFGVWRGALVLVVGVAVLVVATWGSQASAVFPGWVMGAVTLLAVLGVSTAVHVWWLRPLTLRWDTQCWHLTARGEPQPGRITVCVDLGAWMLLRFTPEAADVLHRGTWLPIQRRGHEAHWHALRCTVYCARPVSLPTAAPF